MSCKREPALAYATLVFAFLLTLIAPAHADTYSVAGFTDYGGAGPVLAIDTSGDVLFGDPGCYGFPPNADYCYSLYERSGVIENFSSIPPYDFTGYSVLDLTGVTPLILTNNGYEVDFEGQNRLLYGGPEGDLQLISTGVVADLLAINSYGDIAWTNGLFEENFVAYDITAHETPEPATITMLAIGIAAFTIMRRKRPQH